MATKLKLDPKIISADFTAGLTTALVTIPDGLASAILAGLNPVHGLYALMVGMPVAALTMSSQFMYVANTGALAVATGDALSDYGPEELACALVVLAIIVGLVQVAFDVVQHFVDTPGVFGPAGLGFFWFHSTCMSQAEYKSSHFESRLCPVARGARITLLFLCCG